MGWIVPFVIDMISNNLLTLTILFFLAIIILTGLGGNPKGTECFRVMLGMLFLQILLASFEYIVGRMQWDYRLLYIKCALEYWIYSAMLLLEIWQISTIKNKWLLTIPMAILVIVCSHSFFGVHLVFGYRKDYSFISGPYHFLPYLTGAVYLLLSVYFSLQYLNRHHLFRGMQLLSFSVVSLMFIGVCEYYGLVRHLFDEIAALNLLVYYFYFAEAESLGISVRLHKREMELEKSKSDLLQANIQLLQAQISPHFIFNSLMAIQAQCLTAPDRVYDSIDCFSGYLRAKLNAMTGTQLIPFSQEIELIENYVELEKINYGDRLRIEYDLQCKDFLLPALTLQPIVENAIRHGIGPHETGGLIRISSRAEEDRIILTVEDDGSGSSGMTVQQEKRRGIGLQNVRSRLNFLNMGTMEMETNGEGTRVVFTLHRVNE